MIDSLSLQEKLKGLFECPDLSLSIKSEWASIHPQHRINIHADIGLKSDHAKTYTSISHCPLLGGFVKSPLPVGIDIEITGRVQWRVVHRVSSQIECSEAPNAAALWSAKEASYKALKHYSQPSVLSQISIGVWEKIDSQTEKFELLNFSDFQAPASNKGIVIQDEKVTLSFFIFYP